MVEALWQPFCRMTSAALPVNTAYKTLPSPSSSIRFAISWDNVVLPVPAKPNNRNICGEFGSMNHCRTATKACSCCVDQVISRRLP